MNDRLYKVLRNIALALAVAWLGWEAYDSFFSLAPGDRDYFAGNRLFEDGAYERALDSYRDGLAEAPDHIHALRGVARSLMMLGRDEEALAVFNEAIARAPEVGATYANRGILYDRMGRHRKAMADYETALRLDPELAEGPNWLTRFLRNQPERPPTIADRLAYLREQFALPEDERVLQVPEMDERQRPYKM